MPASLSRVQKFLIAAITIAVTVGGPYFDILKSSDLSDTDGIIKAVLAVLGAAGVYQVANR